MDNVKLFSNKVWLAEEQGDPDALIAKIVICDFSINKNGVMLNRDTIGEWMSSLVNAPLVGRIKAKSNGEIDFTSHNATVITRVDENGNEYADIEFNTDAFGTFISVEIETIDDVECIVATAKVWKRFYDASNLILKRIKEGTLSTSWEISVEKSKKQIRNGVLVKVVDKGRFIGHALLSETTAPAYDISRVLEVAAENEEEDLYSALIRDVMKMNDSNGNEVEKMEDEKTIDTSEEEAIAGGVEIGEEKGEETPASDEETGTAEGKEKEVTEPVVEKSDLTLWDIRKKVDEAICHKLDVYWLDMLWLFPVSFKAWAHKPDADELNVLEFTYSVNNDEVTVSDPVEMVLTVSPREINATLSARSDTIINLNNKVNELQAQVDALSPYKAAAEQSAREKAEAERKEAVAELRTYAEESGMLTKDELASGEIAEMIESLKETDLKVLISDRIVAKQKGAKPTETSQKRVAKMKAEINFQEETSNPVEALRKFIQRG